MFEDEVADAPAAAWTVPIGWTAGDIGRCRSCDAEVMWCTTPRGKKNPVDPDGKSHFASCPQADQWRKRGAH